MMDVDGVEMLMSLYKLYKGVSYLGISMEGVYRLCDIENNKKIRSDEYRL